jgi:hypothetical protein
MPGVGDSVAKGVQIAYFLCDNAQLLAGAEALYLRAEDLAKGHVPEVERGPVCESGAAGSSSPPLQKTYLQINHLLDVLGNWSFSGEKDLHYIVQRVWLLGKKVVYQE